MWLLDGYGRESVVERGAMLHSVYPKNEYLLFDRELS
jgi:hypothetical protein